MPNLYDPQVIKKLFDEMAGTYGLVNVVSSFGFCRRWRRQCLEAVSVPMDARAVDLMTGMGELCPDLSRRLGSKGKILALDISEVMCRHASGKKFDCPVEIVQADVLTYEFETAGADAVVSSFGLKTLSLQQIATLARVIAACLKPGGVFSFVEISVPPWPPLRCLYMFYVRRVIPLIGWAFLGNPDNYRQLGVYTHAFGNCGQAMRIFREAGLEVEYRVYFLDAPQEFRGEGRFNR